MAGTNEGAKTVPVERMGRKYAGARYSQPAFYNPYTGAFGYSVIPRRGVNRHLVNGRVNLKRTAEDTPLRLLTLLPDLVPSIGLALWNALRLTCSPEDLQIVAVKNGDDGKEAIDDEGTASIKALWESLPNEIGGFVGLQKQLMQMAILTGMICVEPVPGPRLKGLSQVWPVDSLSIFFRRDPDTSLMVPLQRQINAKEKPNFAGYTILNIDPDRFYWGTVDPMVDEPYGRAPYAPAVSEALCDIALIQDLRDSVHNAAWPRLGFGFNFVEMAKVAKEVYALEEPEASKWVQDRFSEAVAQVGDIKAEDNIFYDSSGKMVPIEGSKGFVALEHILNFLRQRLTQSLKTLPTLMGINDGTTQTYTTVEWAIYAAGLESLREVVATILTRVAQLHLRLQGSPLKAIAKVKAIRTSDGMLEAQAEGLRIANAKEKVALGWISNEEAAVEITGSGPVGPAQAAPAPPAAQQEEGTGEPDKTKDKEDPEAGKEQQAA